MPLSFSFPSAHWSFCYWVSQWLFILWVHSDYFIYGGDYFSPLDPSFHMHITFKFLLFLGKWLVGLYIYFSTQFSIITKVWGLRHRGLCFFAILSLFFKNLLLYLQVCKFPMLSWSSPIILAFVEARAWVSLWRALILTSV